MQKQLVLGLALSLATFLFVPDLFAQGLVVNEVSNGPAGSQEYIELVVVGPTSNPNCGPIDIRGWIVDDNNGDFSCGACASTGIASGHLRFGNLAVWSAVPTGSIIVIYDPTIKNPMIPADDHDDTAVPNQVYILPSNDVLLEASTTPCAGGNVPSGLGACGTCTGVISYTGACYTAGVANTSWGLRNAGDAAQVRRPNGAYFHGIGFGNAGSLITGGPDALLVSNLSGTGLCYSFMNLLSDDFRLVGNYSTATVASLAETPGAGNGPNNTAWIASLKLGCPLAVSYYSTLAARVQGSANLLTWATASEVNADRWEVLRSLDLAQGFAPIGTVAAVGNSSSIQDYSFVDAQPAAQQVWYQLRQWDRNGGSALSETVSLHNGQVTGNWVDAWPNPNGGQLKLQGSLPQLQNLRVLDLLGRIVLEMPLHADNDFFAMEIDLGNLPSGNYLLQLQGRQNTITRRISLQRGL